MPTSSKASSTGAGDGTSTGARAGALVEVSVASSAMVLAAYLFEAYMAWERLWEWYFKAFCLLIALSAVVLPGRSLGAYGFSPADAGFTVKWGLIFSTVFVAPAAVSTLIAAEPTKLSPPDLALDVVYFMFFSGLVEEACFRGYVQTRLNSVYGRRYRSLVFEGWKVEYGPGLILASSIFGVVHLANYVNPLTSRYDLGLLVPAHVLASTALGCLLGAVREASGNIYVPASLHGSINTAHGLLSIYAGDVALVLSLSASWSIFLLILSKFFAEAERRRVLGPREAQSTFYTCSARRHGGDGGSSAVIYSQQR